MSNQIIILFFSQPTHPLTASRALPLPLGATALRPGVMVSHILGTVSHILGMHSRWCNSSLTWSWFREGGPPWWNSEKRGKCATLLPPPPSLGGCPPPPSLGGWVGKRTVARGKKSVFRSADPEISCWVFFFSVVSQVVRTKVFSMHNLDFVYIVFLYWNQPSHALFY